MPGLGIEANAGRLGCSSGSMAACQGGVETFGRLDPGTLDACNSDLSITEAEHAMIRNPTDNTLAMEC